MTPESGSGSGLHGTFFYGWAVAGAGLAVSFMALGTRLSFGVFFTSLEFEFELNRTMTSGIFSVYMTLCCAVSVLGGWASDRWGPKPVTLLMGLITGGSLILTSFASRGWHLLFTYGLLFALGTGGVFAVVNATVSRWFSRKRGLAVGITSSGGGVGAVFIAPMSAMFISAFGWRISLLILGIITGIVMACMAFVLRSDPREMGLHPDGVPEPPQSNHSDALAFSGKNLTSAEALRMKDFWLLFGNWLLLSAAVHLVIVHVAPCATDRGLTVVDAAYILSLMGMASIPGRLVVGRVSDLIGRRSLSILSGFFQTAALVGLIFASGNAAFYVCGLLFGFGWGGFSTTVTAVVGDLFGVRSLGVIMGCLSAAWAFGAALGPAAGGLAFDLTGSYTSAFIGAAMALVSASALVLPLGARGQTRF